MNTMDVETDVSLIFKQMNALICNVFQANSNAYRMQNQSTTIGSHTLHSISVQKEVITDAPDNRSVDAKYAGDDVYGHPKLP